MKTKLVCTGSGGFLIGNFIRKAIYEKHPYNIVSVDKVSTNATNSIYWNKNHTFHIADLRDSHVVDTIFQFEKPDIVLHGAANTSDDLDPNSFITNNILATQNVINACVKHKVSKLVYCSTDQIYGQLTSEQDLPWTEESIPNPRNQYSTSKYCGELLIKEANYSHELNYNVIRFSNNYGPRQMCEKLIPKTIKNIINDISIPIYGQGLQMRDWTHVFDSCSALLTVLSDGKLNEIYNVSANQEYTNIEVVQRVCNIMEKGHNLLSFVTDPMKSRDFRYSLDCSKIKKLGWETKIKFKEGLVESYNWLNNNQWFMR